MIKAFDQKQMSDLRECWVGIRDDLKRILHELEDFKLGFYLKIMRKTQKRF